MRIPGFDHITVTDDVSPAEVARARAEGPTDESLRLVAHIHQTAAAIGDSPVKAVVNSIGISRPTATRWVRKAREKGFLDG